MSILQWIHNVPINLKEVDLLGNRNFSLHCLEDLFLKLPFVEDLYANGLHIGAIRTDEIDSINDIVGFKHFLSILCIDLDHAKKTAGFIDINVWDRTTLKLLRRMAGEYQYPSDIFSMTELFESRLHLPFLNLDELVFFSNCNIGDGLP